MPHLRLVCLPSRLPSKSLPHLPGTPRPAFSLPPGSVKAAPAQARPPSPGNIRPGKREAKGEPEKKDPEKDPQTTASEPPLKGRAPLVKVAEVAAQEVTPVEPEADTGENDLAGSGTRLRSSAPMLFFSCTVL